LLKAGDHDSVHECSGYHYTGSIGYSLITATYFIDTEKNRQEPAKSEDIGNPFYVKEITKKHFFLKQANILEWHYINKQSLTFFHPWIHDGPFYSGKRSGVWLIIRITY